MSHYKTFLERELNRVLTGLGIPFRAPKNYFDLVPHGRFTDKRDEELKSIESLLDVEADGINIGTMLAGAACLFDEEAPLFRYQSGEINGTSLVYGILMSDAARTNLEFRDLDNKPRDPNILKKMKRRYAEETITIQDASEGSEHIVLYLPRGDIIHFVPQDQSFPNLDSPEYVKHFFDVIGQPANMQNKKILADKVKALFEKIKAGSAHA